MPDRNIREMEGMVTAALPNAMFRVRVDDTAPEEWRGKEILCTLSGKMRIYHIRVMPGDRARIQVTPYDDARGRIIFRFT